jgi:hypothetical protein
MQNTLDAPVVIFFIVVVVIGVAAPSDCLRRG